MRRPPSEGILLPFAFFSLLYLGLGAASIWLLRREVSVSPFFPTVGDAPGQSTPEGRE